MFDDPMQADPEGAGAPDVVPGAPLAPPSLDDPSAADAGVLLLGLDAERLLAGLGLAALADDLTLVTLAVDRIRQDPRGALTTGHLVALGARRWRRARDGLAAAGAADPPAGPPWRAWAQACRVVHAAREREPVSPGLSAACAAYLAACWIHRAAIDELASKASFAD